ncbi:MAG: hypothetical protein ACI31R_05580 [Bacilli bacterium]
MNKLEVGMYVRTIDGIMKVKNIYQDGRENMDRFENEDGNIYFFNEIIGEPSFNPIDLIEVGDILEINNEKYEVIYDESYEKLEILIPSKKELSIRHSSLEYVFKKYKVSIVTKEQFSKTEYRLGDK